jgi:hypothetical protein
LDLAARAALLGGKNVEDLGLDIAAGDDEVRGRARSRGGFSTIWVTENKLPWRSPMPTTPYMWMRSAGIFSTAMMFALSPRSRAASIIG